MKKQPWDLLKGDRILETHHEALRLAESRALRRGRQRVWVRPPSRWIHRTTFVVQDVR